MSATAAAAVDQHQNGTLLRGPLQDIQENEPLNPQPSEVKVTIRENSIQEKQTGPSLNTVTDTHQNKVKPPRTPLERFLISTCILLSSCVCVLLLLLIVQAFFTGKKLLTLRSLGVISQRICIYTVCNDICLLHMQMQGSRPMLRVMTLYCFS